MRGATTSTVDKTATTASAVASSTGEKFALQQVAKLDQPLAFTLRANDPSIYIAEKGGTVKRLVVEAGKFVTQATILDIKSKIAFGDEQGLLGIAFSRDGSKLYADYTNKDGDLRIVEYPYNGVRANPLAERVVLAIPHPGKVHNGGNLVFGPDGLLYIGVGDGGAGSGDPQNAAQSLNTLLGKILRINPAKYGNEAYSVPPDNPFFNQAGKRGEIWHYGLRNPWRFSFDKANNELWIGDVGEAGYEEVNHVAAGAKGLNFGWVRREGKHAYNKGASLPGDVEPVYELSHEDKNCSVTGGYVYRGAALPSLVGTYLFADACKGQVLGGNGANVRTLVTQQVPWLVAFGEDQSGEIYVLSVNGPIYRLVKG